MKNLKQDAYTTLNKRHQKSKKSMCSCPTGASNYCNRVLKLPFELVDYSLKCFTDKIK